MQKRLDKLNLADFKDTYKNHTIKMVRSFKLQLISRAIPTFPLLYKSILQDHFKTFYFPIA